MKKVNVAARAVYLALWLLTSLVIAITIVSPGSPSMQGKGVGASRELRRVDMQKLLRLIQEGRLSDKEAMFYRTLVEPHE